MNKHTAKARLPMKQIRELIEQAYLIALECKDAQLILHLGLAMQVSFAKEVIEQIRQANAASEDISARETIKLAN